MHNYVILKIFLLAGPCAQGVLAIRRDLCPWGAKSSHDPRSHVLGLVLANKIAQLGSSSATRNPAKDPARQLLGCSSAARIPARIQPRTSKLAFASLIPPRRIPNILVHTIFDRHGHRQIRD